MTTRSVWYLAIGCLLLLAALLAFHHQHQVLDCYPQQRSEPVSWTCVEGR